jgi:dipeptidyl-peptidase-4
MKGRFLILASIFLTMSNLSAQQKKNITLDDIWKNPIWRAEGIEDINWFKSGDKYSALKDENIEVYDIKSGLKIKTLIEGKDLKIDTAQIGIQNYTLSPDENMVLIETGIEPIYRRSSKAFFFLYNLSTKKLSAISAGKKIVLKTTCM